MILNGIGAGFVQRLDEREIIANRFRAEQPEFHRRAFRENCLAMPAQLQQAHARHHLMRLAAQLFQHAMRALEIRGFAKQSRAQIHERVRPDHQRVGMAFRDRTRLAIGVELGNFRRGQLLVVQFLRVAGDDGEFRHQFSQQVRAARRRGGQNDRWQIHAITAFADNAGIAPKAERNRPSLRSNSASASTSCAPSVAISRSNSIHDLQPPYADNIGNSIASGKRKIFTASAKMAFSRPQSNRSATTSSRQTCCPRKAFA